MHVFFSSIMENGIHDPFISAQASLALISLSWHLLMCCKKKQKGGPFLMVRSSCECTGCVVISCLIAGLLEPLLQEKVEVHGVSGNGAWRWFWLLLLYAVSLFYLLQVLGCFQRLTHTDTHSLSLWRNRGDRVHFVLPATFDCLPVFPPYPPVLQSTHTTQPNIEVYCYLA